MSTVKEFRLKAKIHNLKWYLFRWNLKAFEPLFTYIHHSLASLSVLFKHKSLIFDNLSLFLHLVSIFWLEHLYVLPKLQRAALKVHILWCKTGIHSWDLSEKYAWCLTIHFQFHFFTIWSISASILSIITWKAPATRWLPSELAMFLKFDPRRFRMFSKFQDVK